MVHCLVLWKLLNTHAFLDMDCTIIIQLHKGYGFFLSMLLTLKLPFFLLPPSYPLHTHTHPKVISKKKQLKNAILVEKVCLHATAKDIHFS